MSELIDAVCRVRCCPPMIRTDLGPVLTGRAPNRLARQLCESLPELARKIYAARLY
jgi:hypothetical protein